MDPREPIANTAIATWGLDYVKEVPGLINVAGLGFAMGERLILHRWTRDAIDMVHATDLHSLPDEPPRLLRRAWLIETSHPDRGQALWGRTACLGGYQLEEAGPWWLVGLQWPDGIAVATWRPVWSGGELEEGIESDPNPLVSDVEGHREWGLEAARFAVVAGLLLDAAGSPVRSEAAEGSKAAQRRERSAGRESWAVRRVVLASASSSPASASSTLAGGSTAPDGRRPVEAEVRGHLKRQRHGPGGQLRRWIWVEGYQARRWITAKPLRIDVRVH